MAEPGFHHRPVLLDESLGGLAIRRDGIYIDCTFGRGGHSAAILDRLGKNGRLIALDRDAEAVASAARRFGDDDRFVIEHVSFDRLADIADRHGVTGEVDGILLDLGVSSPQLDDPQRGFSFMNDGPLDMRMDPALKEFALVIRSRAKFDATALDVKKTYVGNIRGVAVPSRSMGNSPN